MTDGRATNQTLQASDRLICVFISSTIRNWWRPKLCRAMCLEWLNQIASTGQFTPPLARPRRGAVDFGPFHNTLASCGSRGDSLGEWLAQEFENRFAHLLWILLRHDAAGVAADFRTFADIGRAPRHAARDRFADHVRNAFVRRRADKHVEVRVDGVDVVADAES